MVFMNLHFSTHTFRLGRSPRDMHFSTLKLFRKLFYRFSSNFAVIFAFSHFAKSSWNYRGHPGHFVADDSQVALDFADVGDSGFLCDFVRNGPQEGGVQVVSYEVGCYRCSMKP